MTVVHNYVYKFKFRLLLSFPVFTVKYLFKSPSKNRYQIEIKALFLYLNLYLGTMLNSLPCPFTAISLLTNTCSFVVNFYYVAAEDIL